MLEHEIKHLISLKTEGGYWDYKEKWHSNNGNLLHDIICLANNLEDRDAYLIIGVDNDGDVLGVPSENRKNQQNLIDFLKDKKFAGGVRPIVFVQVLEIDGNTVDVITIKNTDNTPYYLSEDFQGVFKWNIYTRVVDVNTAKNSMADINHVEYLWKKRFGIDKAALEKAKHLLLDPYEWRPMGTDGIHSTINYENHGIWFNRCNPEFTISYEQDESIFDKGEIKEIEHTLYWMKKLSNPFHHSYSYKVHVKFHTTVLYSAHALFTDNCKIMRMMWKKSTLFAGWKIFHIFPNFYCFIEKDSIEYLLDTWLCNHYESEQAYEDMHYVDPMQTCQLAMSGNPYAVVPVFESSEEHERFIKFVRKHENEMMEILDCYKGVELSGYANPDGVDCLCKIGETLVEWLDKWRMDKVQK